MPNLPKCPVPVLMDRTYRRVGTDMKVCTELTEVFGTGIDAVPNLPKCPVPVLMDRTYRSVRYRYKSLYRYRRYRYPCHTKLTEVSGTGSDVVPNLPNEVSGTGSDVVPNLPKCPVPAIPPVYTGGVPRYVPYRTHPW